MASARNYIGSIISTASDLYNLEEVLNGLAFKERLREINEDLSSLLEDAEEQ